MPLERRVSTSAVVRAAHAESHAEIEKYLQIYPEGTSPFFY
jgi:hypothetical protein